MTPLESVRDLERRVDRARADVATLEESLRDARREHARLVRHPRAYEFRKQVRYLGGDSRGSFWKCRVCGCRSARFAHFEQALADYRDHEVTQAHIDAERDAVTVLAVAASLEATR